MNLVLLRLNLLRYGGGEWDSDMYDHSPHPDFGVRWPILSEPFRAVVTGKVKEDDRA